MPLKKSGIASYMADSLVRGFGGFENALLCYVYFCIIHVTLVDAMIIQLQQKETHLDQLVLASFLYVDQMEYHL